MKTHGEGAKPVMQATYYYLVRKHTGMGSGEALVVRAENVFKIAMTYSEVRKYLTGKGWEFQGKDQDMEMDSFRNEKTGKKLFVEDISEDFPVTFLMGDLSLTEFSDLTNQLTPEIKLLEVDSSWEGKATTIVVAMTEGQVRNMFGARTKMRKVAVHRAAPQI
jgi:hypothetical protein